MAIKSIKDNFFWMTGGRAIYALSQWSLLIIIAQLTTPVELGEFSLALAITSPIIVFAQMNMRAFMITQESEIYSPGIFIFSRLITISIAMISISVVAVNINQSMSAALIVFVVGLYKSFESISDIYYGILQKKEIMRHIGISVAIHGLTSVLVMALFVFLFDSVMLGAVGISIVWLLILYFYDMRIVNVHRSIQLEVNISKAKEVIRNCFPLGLVLMMLTLRINIPVYFIKAEWGVEYVGYYSAVAYFIVAGNLVTGSLVQASAPKLALYYHKRNLKRYLGLFVKMISISLIIGLAGIIFAVVFGEQILTIIYGDRYGVYNQLFILVMLAASVGYVSQFFGMGLTISRQFKKLLLSNTLGVLLVLVSSIYLVPIYGLEGGALSLLIGATLTLVSNIVMSYTSIYKNVFAE